MYHKYISKIKNTTRGFTRTPISTMRYARFEKKPRANRCRGFTRTPQRSLVVPKAQRKWARPRLVSGFTLLYASLIAALLLTIGLAIFNIVLKELELSVGARESAVAFYKADTGVECALYHDFQSDVFATSTVGPRSISCAGQVVDVAYNGPYLRSFWFVRDSNPACNPTVDPDIAVSIFKSDSPRRQTMIISSGISSCDQSNIRRAQRTLQVIY